MIITLSGKPGSGKSTIAKMLAEKLGFKRYYMGEIRRRLAKSRGLTLEEFNKLGEKEIFTDKEVDEYQKRLGETEDNLVIEGRVAFHFIPNSLKIFLDVNEEEGARRIFQSLQESNDRNEGMDLNTPDDVLESIQKRMESDNFRYQKYYNLDVFNPKHYDFVLDTSNLSIEEVFQKIYKFIAQKMKNVSKEK